jgi:hypothetical protein
MVEERAKEVQETRREFARLSRDIVEGMQKKLEIPVVSRQNERYFMVIHALTEVTILEATEKTGLTLADLTKRDPLQEDYAAAVTQFGADSQQATDARQKLQDGMSRNPDPKTLAKMRFLDEIVAAAQVGSDLTPEELRTALPASERARLFSVILEISGLGPKTTETLEKFRSRQVAGSQ